MNCDVCRSVQKKYKCPKCQTKYCGIECFQKHVCNAPKKKDSPILEPIIKSEFVDEDVKLSSDKLQLLKNSQKIRKYVSNSKLKKVLLRIDNQKHRFNELNRQIKYDKDFEEFAHLLLSEMKCIDENGQFDG